MEPNLLSTIHTVTDAQTPLLHKIFPGLRAITHMPFALYHTRASICKPRIYAFFTSLRASTPLPIGTAGFCWGGKYVTLLCQGSDNDDEKEEASSLVDCGFAAHPSGLDLPTDVEAVRLPLSICNGSLDFQLKAEGNGIIEEVFERKEGELNKDGKRGRMFEMEVMEGARHGFAIRGDPGDEEEKRRGLMAEDQAVEFFGRWLVPKSG